MMKLRNKNIKMLGLAFLLLAKVAFGPPRPPMNPVPPGPPQLPPDCPWSGGVTCKNGVDTGGFFLDDGTRVMPQPDWDKPGGFHGHNWYPNGYFRPPNGGGHIPIADGWTSKWPRKPPLPDPDAAKKICKKIPVVKYLLIGGMIWTVGENAYAGDAYGTADAIADFAPFNPFDIYRGGVSIWDLGADIYTYGWDNSGVGFGMGGAGEKPSEPLPLSPPPPGGKMQY